MSASSGVGPADWDGATYDRIADPQATWGRAVLDLLDLHGDERVLDAGCGSGRVTEQLLDRHPDISVVALDAAPSMLAEARTRLARFGSRVEYVEADLARPLPVDGPLAPVGGPFDEPVDVILSTAALHWVLDHDRLFVHLAAVLRPGGRLVAQCGGAGNIDSVVTALRQVDRHEPSPWLFATPDDTCRRLEAAGFTDVDAWLHDEPTPFDTVEGLETFLATVILRSHLDRLPADERQPLVASVAQRLGSDPVLDYVRLTMVATRG